ncbi:LysE family translocator [Algicola sagamiensis]|uniref:LysE family translocator n=1 Tax=Algicola sagamiensis TaxID=163869 RepID=UPI00036CAA84|nr:LysE family transporter [Algicola sagamiensis]
MDLVSLIFPTSAFAFTSSATPGPNNLWLTASSMNFGWRRTLPFLFGIRFGLIGLLVGLCLGLGVVIETFPEVKTGLTVMGTLYLIYLGLRLWKMPAGGQGKEAEPPGFWTAFAFQYVNPKCWLTGIASVSAHTLPGADYFASSLQLILIWVVIGTFGNIIWLFAGEALRGWLAHPTIGIKINKGLAILTWLTIGLLW